MFFPKSSGFWKYLSKTTGKQTNSECNQCRALPINWRQKNFVLQNILNFFRLERLQSRTQLLKLAKRFTEKSWIKLNWTELCSINHIIFKQHSVLLIVSLFFTLGQQNTLIGIQLPPSKWPPDLKPVFHYHHHHHIVQLLRKRSNKKDAAGLLKKTKSQFRLDVMSP